MCSLVSDGGWVLFEVKFGAKTVKMLKILSNSRFFFLLIVEKLIQDKRIVFLTKNYCNKKFVCLKTLSTLYSFMGTKLKLDDL